MNTSRVHRFNSIFLQNIMMSIHGSYALRTPQKPIYKKEQKQYKNKEYLLQLQYNNLQIVEKNIAIRVSYCRDAFTAAKFSSEQLKSLSDIQCIPLLNKNQIFNTSERMMAETWKATTFPGRISCTTGQTLKLAHSMHSIHRENALLWQQRRWVSATLGNRRVWICGDKVVPSNTQKRHFWCYIKADNTLRVAVYHLSEQNIKAYLQAPEAYDPIFDMTSPSPLIFWARYLLNTNRKYRGKSLKFSESANPKHRKIVKKTFGCRVFDWYGSAEQVSVIGTCEQGNYHVLSDYGYTELVPQENGVYELVGTGFDNLLIPLIRYQSEDTIVPADSDCQCPLGRIGFPVVGQIIDRVKDYLIRQDSQQIFMMRNITKVSEDRVAVEQVNEIPKTSNRKFCAVARAI